MPGESEIVRKLREAGAPQPEKPRKETREEKSKRINRYIEKTTSENGELTHWERTYELYGSEQAKSMRDYRRRELRELEQERRNLED